MKTPRKRTKRVPPWAPGYRDIDTSNADRVKAMADGAEWCARFIEGLANGLPEVGKEAHGTALLSIASSIRGMDFAFAADAFRVERARLPRGYAVRAVGLEHVTYKEGRTVEPSFQAVGPGWEGERRHARWLAVQDALVHSGEFTR